MPRRYQIIGGGSAFASGGVSSGVIPKSNGAGQLADSALTDNGTTVTSTERFVGPTSSTVAQLSDTATNGSGWAISGGNIWGISSGTRVIGQSGTSNFILGANIFLNWSSNADPGIAGADTIFRRRSAANVALGAADLNGTPVAQTLSVQNAITGSNLPAANATIDLGLGTGTGLTGTLVVRGGDSSVATGTTAQTNIVRCVMNATKALTTGAATTLVSIPLATLQMTGGYISVYMEATDGTSQATRSEEIYYAGENSAGVFVVSTGVVGTGVTACTAAKTLTATYALTGANPALLQVTPTLTGITATRFTCIYEVHHMGNTQPTV
jgi:hypothetical protein